jgi:hypothetical protein
MDMPLAVRLHRRVLKTGDAVNGHFDVLGLGTRGNGGGNGRDRDY